MHWIDPDSLSPVKSKVARFLFNPKGDADGMLLADGTEAHFPPHLSDKVLQSIRPGDAVTLYGIKPRAADMILRGEARTVADTVVIEARAWGKSKARMKPVTPKPHS